MPMVFAVGMLVDHAVAWMAPGSWYISNRGYHRSFLLSDVPRMEKSPLLANGYNHPPTHLSHMQFMQLGGHPGAGHTAILSPASLPHHLQAQAQARVEQGLKVNPNMSNIEALAR